MSLTYSLNRSGLNQSGLKQPNQGLSRAAIIAFIALLHVGAFIAFNNGIGHFLKSDPPPDITVINVPVDPPAQTPVPVPQVPKSLPQQTLTPPIVDPTQLVMDAPPEAIALPPSEPADATSGSTIPTVSKLTVTFRTDPVYPTSAQAAGKEGVVLLDAQVDPYGNVVNVSITQSSGFTELDNAAVLAVKRWHFAPISTGAHVRVPIRFQLNSQKH